MIKSILKEKQLKAFLSGSIGNTLVRFGYFFVLSLTITSYDLGLFTTILYGSALLLPLFALGSYNLILKQSVETGNHFQFLYRYSMVSFLFSVIALLFIFFSLKLLSPSVFIKYDFYILLRVFYAEFILTLIGSLFKSISLAKFDDSIKKDAIINVSTSICLFISVVLFLFFDDTHSINTWSWYYLTIACLTLLIRGYVWRNDFDFPLIFPFISTAVYQFRVGLPFMLSATLRSLFINADKFFVVSIFGLEIAGLYAIATRFYNVFVMVLNSISAVHEGNLYKYALNRFSFMSKVIEINKKTIIFFIIILHFAFITSYFVSLIYGSTVFYMFAIMMFVCPFHLVSFTYLNALNSLDLSYVRLYILIAAFLINLITVFIFNSFGWCVIVFGAFASYSFTAFVSYNVIMRKVNE